MRIRVNKKYNYILFDLDGTLTDSAPGITNSIMYALKHFGIRIEDRLELYKFVGPPLHDTFSKYFHFTEEETNEAITLYREYFTEKGMFENVVYQGIPPLLKNLKASDKKLILATSKPTQFAEKILEHFDLLKYFDFVVGSNLDGTRRDKGEIIRFVLEHYNITECGNVVMIGDREHDVIGARNCGIKSIGVLYGYGDKQELEDAGADYIAQTVEELEHLLSVTDC